MCEQLNQKLADGTIATVVKATDRDLIAKPSGVVRGQLPIAGVTMKPLEGGKACWVTMVAEINFNGPLPDWIMTLAFSNQGYNI